MTNPEWWRDEKLPPVVGRAMDSDDGPQGRIYNCGYNWCEFDRKFRVGESWNRRTEDRGQKTEDRSQTSERGCVDLIQSGSWEPE